MKLHNRKPDIENLYKVLRCEEPSRPVLFELFMNRPLYERLAGRTVKDDSPLEGLKLVVEAYAAAGYDYATTHGSNFNFGGRRNVERKNTISLNQGNIITDEQAFREFVWPEPSDSDFSRLEQIRPYIPEGMKLMCMGPGGVLENVIALTGYDNLCFMMHDTPDLVQELFNKVGETLLKYYEIVVQYDTVGLLMSNDDWGFKTQTFLAPPDMRKYVFPWHKKYVELAHSKKIPALLHSCGFATDVMDDIINYIGFDGKHSFEDTIVPIEDSYELYNGKIGLLGGIDVDFIIKHSEDEIAKRCRAMLKRAEGRGGYALGTGNSIPEYIPQEHVLAMFKAALEY